MKCPDCGYDALFLGGWEDSKYKTTRKYRCVHGHHFVTLEVLPTAVSKREADRAENFAEAKAKRFERDQQILEDLSTMSAEELGVKYKLTGTRVRQIRDTINSTKEPNDTPHIPTHATETQSSGATRHLMGGD